MQLLFFQWEKGFIVPLLLSKILASYFKIGFIKLLEHTLTLMNLIIFLVELHLRKIMHQIKLTGWKQLYKTHYQHASEKIFSCSTCDIYYARQLNNHLGKLMALKVFKSREKPSQIIRELIGKKLKNVIEFYQISTGDPAFTLMELCQQNLTNLVIQGEAAQRSERIIEIAGQIVNGLIQLKSNWIIHGDIKRQNLVYSQQRVIKICDIDFAVKQKDTIQKKFRVGTFPYMSPEVLLEGSVSYKSDVWSLGIVLYQLYFGQHPFPYAYQHEHLTELDFRNYYNIINSELNSIKKKLLSIKTSTQSENVCQIMDIVFHCLVFAPEHRKGLEQLLLLTQTKRHRAMSQMNRNHCMQLQPQRIQQKTAISLFQHLDEDLKKIDRNDILLKKSKNLQQMLISLVDLLSMANSKYQNQVKCLLVKFSLQSQKISQLIRGNLKRLGEESIRLASYQQKLNFVEHLQTTVNYINKHFILKNAPLNLYTFQSADNFFQKC